MVMWKQVLFCLGARASCNTDCIGGYVVQSVSRHHNGSEVRHIIVNREADGSYSIIFEEVDLGSVQFC